MSSVVTLSEAKLHLRVTSTSEDSLITLYIEAAQEYIQNFLNRPSVPYTASVRSAALLIIGDLYEHRQANLDMQSYVNPTVMNLLYPYREEIGI